MDLSKLARDSLHQKEGDRIQGMLTAPPTNQAGYVEEINRDRSGGQTHVIRMTDGSRTFGEPGTTGVLGLGDKVAVVQSAGVGAQLFAMPG